MKISILTYGSAGDVVPYVSLALGLMDRGHDITLAAPQNFESLVKKYNINYSPLFGDIDQILQTDDAKVLLAAGDVKTITKKFAEIRYTNRHAINRDLLTAVTGAELIISGTLTLLQSATISEKLNIPIIVANVNPVSASTKKFPHFFISSKVLPFGFLNRYTFNLFFKTNQKAYTADLSEWRNSLGLPANKSIVYNQLRKLKTPYLFGYSPNLLPKPNDWGSNIAVSGVWKLDAKYLPAETSSNDLADWLAAGSTPIYFGFGSMPVTNPEEVARMVNEICAELGVRAVLNAGWSKFENRENNLTDTVFFIKHTNLEWLFPQCSIIVHHGGVGTAHISAESGTPTIICSIFADNPLWGERLETLKIGKHIKFKELTKVKLIAAIKALQNEEIKKRAKATAEHVKAENGLKSALDFLEANLKNAVVYNEN